MFALFTHKHTVTRLVATVRVRLDGRCYQALNRGRPLLLLAADFSTLLHAAG